MGWGYRLALIALLGSVLPRISAAESGDGDRAALDPEEAEETSLASLDDAAVEKNKAVKQTLWGWRRWHRPHSHHRHSPHSHTPLQGGAARSTCECQGDPHCMPFHGNFFDIQQEGVFDMVSGPWGPEKVQMSTFVCRQPQDWSGGLTVKCNKAIAIRIDDNNVFTVHNI